MNGYGSSVGPSSLVSVFTTFSSVLSSSSAVCSCSFVVSALFLHRYRFADARVAPPIAGSQDGGTFSVPIYCVADPTQVQPTRSAPINFYSTRFSQRLAKYALSLLCLSLSLSLSLSFFLLSSCYSLLLLAFMHTFIEGDLVWCPSIFELIEGDFPCPRVLAAWEIGANEVVSLLVWSRPLLSR